MARYIKPQIAVIAAILLLVIPLPWLFAWILAAVVHEMCHCIAVWICSGHLTEIEIGLQGAEIQSYLENHWQSVVCSLAGPMGGVALFVFSEEFPRLAVCALVQTTYNLFPIYPLDGGRILHSIMDLIFPSKIGKFVCNCIEALVIVCMIIVSLALCLVYKLGTLPLLVLLIFLVQTKKIKIPCKWRGHRVQ